MARNRALVSEAATALGRIGDEEALWSLSELFRERSEPKLTLAAAQAIGGIGGAEAVRILAEYAGDEDSGKRGDAILGLAEIHDQEALAVLWPYLWDEDKTYQNVAMRAAALRPVSYMAESMAGVLVDETPENRALGLKILEASVANGYTRRDELESFLPRVLHELPEDASGFKASLERLVTQKPQSSPPSPGSPAVPPGAPGASGAGANPLPVFHPVNHRVLYD